MAAASAGEMRVAGIGGSPGICIGKAYLVDREGVNVVKKYQIPDEMLEYEVARFKDAVNSARDELQQIIDTIPEDFRDNVYILETHVVLHKDKMLYGKTIETIESEKINAEWALKKTASRVKAMFQDISDPYLQGRADDIVQVSDRIMRNLTGHEREHIAEINKRVILVAKDLSPAETSQIQLERIMGFVTDRGGRASHTSIVARTLGIPAVLGMGNATEIIDHDDIIIIDGTAGIIIVNPTEETLIEYENRRLRYEEFQALVARESHLPAETADGVTVKLLGNIELSEEIVSVLDHGGDGIGLFRTEFLYMSRKSFPTEEELFESYKDVVELMAPMPVTIRTLDINGDKALSYNVGPHEVNPALGLRAIRFCLKRPEIFKTQLRAILRASAYGNVQVMFPMISSCEEVIHAKRHFAEVAHSLRKEGIPFNADLPIGIMIEVPSAVVLADALADMVDFFSIGTNDLVQYSLAIDRENTQVAYLYHSLHPAVIRQVKHVVDVGKKKGVKVCMCGEMAGDPQNLPVLLGLGMDELSMNPQSISVVKKMLRSMNAHESSHFIKDVLRRSTTEEVVTLIQERYGNILGPAAFSQEDGEKSEESGE